MADRRSRTGAALSGHGRSRARPCAAIARDVEIAPGGEASHALPARRRRLAGGGERAGRAAPRPRLRRAARRGPSTTGTASSARCRSRRRTRPSTRWSTAGCPIRASACRIRARSAFYQASGAFGFRDQLQDTLAFLLHDPSLAREQILNAASRQFPEGDVQHWWLPRTGAGVRTMISDDVVWLAYADRALHRGDRRQGHPQGGGRPSSTARH